MGLSSDQLYEYNPVTVRKASLVFVARQLKFADSLMSSRYKNTLILCHHKYVAPVHMVEWKCSKC